MTDTSTYRDDTEDELGLWLRVLHAANSLFDQMPPSIQREIDAGASPRELTKMAGPLATLSTETRARIEDVLIDLGAALSPPEADEPQLRLVGPASG
jgi:hypothetical protein